MSKRNPKNWCSVCGKRCKNSRSGLCLRHRREKQAKEYGDSIFVKDLKANNSRHRFQAVRHHAHRIADLYLPEKKCVICGYTFYVELCHVKQIGDFSDTATLTEVNAPENIKWLCPNHHKELDAGIVQW